MRNILIPGSILVIALAVGGCTKAARQSRHTARGDDYLRKEQFANAEVEYLNALRYAPKDPALIRKLGDVFIEQGRIARAIGVFTLLKESQPNDLDARLKLADLLYNSRDYIRGRQEALFVTTNQPANGAALLIVAESSFTTNQLSEATQLVEQALRSTPTPAVRLAAASLFARQGNLTAAEDQLKAIPAEQQKNPSIDSAWAKLRIAQTNLIEGEVFLKRAADASSIRSIRRLQWIDFRIMRGEIAGAKKNLEEIHSKAPDYLPAMLRLADIALSENRFADCDKLTTQALRLEGGSHDALLLRARMWTMQGTLDKAFDELARLDTLFPTNAAVKYELALAQARAGESTKALALADEALNIDPRFGKAALFKAELLLNSSSPNPAAALSTLATLLKQYPNLREGIALVGKAYLMQNRVDDAVRVYKEMTARYPNEPEPWTLLGFALRQARDVTGARAAFEQSVKIAPTFAKPIEQLIDLDISTGDFVSALSRAAELTKRTTNGVEGLLLESRIHLTMTNFAAAEAALDKALQRAPDSFAVFASLANFYLRTKDYDKSLTKVEAALARNPKSYQAWAQKGLLHELKHEPAKAIEAYERSIALNKRFAPALNNLAVLLSQDRAKLDQAYAFAYDAHAAVPGDPAIADTLGWIVYQRGDFMGADRLLSAAAEKLNNSEVHYHAGMASYALGSEEKAKQWFSQALAAKDLRNEFRQKIDQRMAVLNVPGDATSAAQLQTLEAAAKRDPRDYVAQSRLGKMYLNIGRTNDAIRAFEAAAAANTQAAQPLLTLAHLTAATDEKRALEFARNARKIAPNDPATALMLGSLLVRAHDYSVALGLLQEGLRGESARPDILFDLAIAQFGVGKVSEAMTALKSVLQQAAGDTRQHASDALQLVSAGATDPRLSLAEARLKADPNDLLAITALADVRQQQNKPRDAADLFEKALAVAPGFSPAHQRLAVLYYEQLADEKSAYEHALKARQASALDPQIGRILGKVALKQGNFAEALRFLQETPPSATDGESFYLIGLANHGLRRTNEAKMAFTKASTLPLSPDLASDAKRRLAELK